MKKDGMNDSNNPQVKNLFRGIGKKIKDLFRLQEVEVTFNDQKKSYTYRVISHK